MTLETKPRQLLVSGIFVSGGVEELDCGVLTH